MSCKVSFFLNILNTSTFFIYFYTSTKPSNVNNFRSYVSFFLNVFIGQNSYSELFKMFKEIHMVSFQCSPLATSDGIIGTFRQCQKYQMKKDLSKLTAVVILDEVGLAEDSPKMPLKALHPLLEDGCI